VSRWEDLDPEERARLMAIIEAEDPRPDERETFERILARFDVAYARDDPRYWPAAAFILARHAFPEEFSETRGRGAEQVWDEPRLLRLAATALVIRLRHPDWRNLTICRHLVAPRTAMRGFGRRLHHRRRAARTIGCEKRSGSRSYVRSRGGKWTNSSSLPFTRSSQGP
jgi:hypothetical protein